MAVVNSETRRLAQPGTAVASLHQQAPSLLDVVAAFKLQQHAAA